MSAADMKQGRRTEGYPNAMFKMNVYRREEKRKKKKKKEKRKKKNRKKDERGKGRRGRSLPMLHVSLGTHLLHY